MKARTKWVLICAVVLSSVVTMIDAQPGYAAAQEDAHITTGDASTAVDSQNEVNTTTASIPEQTSDTDLSIDTGHEAAISGSASSSSETGGNAASADTGAQVETGNAFSIANVINIANTNIYDSSGLILFLNQLMGGALDLRTLGLSFLFDGPTSTCSLMSCGSDSSVSMQYTNSATIANELLVRASTGGNTAATDAGDASVASGDAFAAANLVNLVNTNLIDSNYLLVAFNNFGDMAGDITLPDASFFDSLLSRGASTDSDASSLSADVSNTLTLSGSTTADASTGVNDASGAGGSSQVESGKAYAAATTFTQANTTLIGGTSVYLLFRVWGTWAGHIQGLPAGVTWRETPYGIELIGTSATGTQSALSGASNTIAATTSNVADIRNDVHVWALTGDNEARTGDGDASIKTGNAYAAANVVNLVNTTILGRNWIFAIFNIFGDWSGNIAFGHPDLWVGAAVQAPSLVQPGNQVTYRFTVANKGDASATGVTLSLGFDTRGLSFELDDIPGAKADETGVHIPVGSLARGQSRDMTLRATTRKILPNGVTPLTLSASVSGNETDEHADDNADSLTLAVGDPPPLVGGIGPGPWQIDPHISMTKTASVRGTVASTSVDYTIDISAAKQGGPVYRAALSDQILAPDGSTLFDKKWDLGTILPGDEIRLTYTVFYGTSTPLGVYSGTARVTGQVHNPVPLYAVDLPQTVASTSLELVPRGQPIIPSQALSTSL